MSALTFPLLTELMPHCPPMLLLDRMVEAAETRAVCEVVIRADGPFCGDAGVPTYVGIEFMAQTVAAYSGWQRRRAGLPIEIGFLLGTPQFQSFCDSFRVGQALHVEVTHVWGADQLARFAGVIKDAHTGVRLQQADLSVFKPTDLRGTLEKMEA